MSRVSRLLSKLFTVAATIGALGLMAIALMICIDVFMRWLTGRPITGVFEFSGVILVMVTFLPLALVLFNNQQLRVDIAQEALSGKPASALSLLDALMGLIVFFLLLWIGVEELIKAYEGRFLLRGMIEIPTWIPIAMISVGTLLALVALAYKAVEHVLNLTGRRPLDEIEPTSDGKN